MNTRPTLTPQTAPADFQSFYWLKEELVAFCRENGLPTSGSKQEISAVITQFLSSGTIPSKSAKSGIRNAAAMPEQFTRETVIGSGWRCSEPLRAFFMQAIGPNFHFNGVMREFIHHGAGKTLQDAIDAWRSAQSARLEKGEIASQFEYNRHMRAFFQENPGKTMQDAIDAWKVMKAQRKSGS